MNFEQLQYVVAVAENGNITKAAEKLFMSQSALTKSMNRLECELGVRLFDRLVSPVQLTSAGEFFLAEARKILGQKEFMEKQLTEYMDFKKGRIHVGMGPGRSEAWLPHILSRFWRAYPNVEVNVITGGTEYLKEELTGRKLDVCFLAVNGDEPPHLSCDLICEERLLFALPWEHPILENHDIPADSFSEPVVLRPEELMDQCFLTAPRKHGITLSLGRILKKYDIKAKKFIPLTSIEVAYALAAEGMGIAYIFETSVNYPGYYKEPVFGVLAGETEKVSLAAVVRAGEPAPFLVRAFVETTKSAVNNEACKIRMLRA